MDTNTILAAFGLTLFAGLSTGIGSTIAFFTRKTNEKMLSVTLGFSAGVMIYISFTEMLSEANILISEFTENDTKGSIITAIAFFSGILLIGIIDRLVPTIENPHEMHKVEEITENKGTKDYKKLYRMGIFAAIAIAIHNFPEGLATFASALKDIKLGLPIAIAIAIHNIPEGIAVSVPIYYSTGSRKKAFMYSFLSGLSEPLGAAIGYLILFSFLNDMVLGILFAGVAGIMVFISLDELLPAAEEYGFHHLSIYGLVAGMLVMAISLLIML